MTLTSIDYANLLRHLAFENQKIVINNTQVNKMLFMCYGTYLVLVQEENRLFEEHPKAWPFGPVFPKVYKTFGQYEMPITIPNEKVALFNANALAMRICRIIVERYSHTSAYDLSMWSHQEGAPWYTTVYTDNDAPIEWNKEIKDEIIKEYFREHPVAY